MCYKEEVFEDQVFQEANTDGKVIRLENSVEKFSIRMKRLLRCSAVYEVQVFC